MCVHFPWFSFSFPFPFFLSSVYQTHTNTKTQNRLVSLVSVGKVQQIKFCVNFSFYFTCFASIPLKIARETDGLTAGERERRISHCESQTTFLKPNGNDCMHFLNVATISFIGLLFKQQSAHSWTVEQQQKRKKEKKTKTKNWFAEKRRMEKLVHLIR